MTAAAHVSSLTPVGDDRSEVLDVLRGFALLGILLVNFWGDQATSGPMQSIDNGVNEGLDVLISSSFYPLFSFLFGLGFAVQLMRAHARGTGVVLVYLRRMMALLLIGAVHSVFIWNGDILLDYAIIGLLLIPVHRLPNAWLLGLTLVLFVSGFWIQSFRAQLQRIGASDANVRAVELEVAARGQLNATANGVRQRADQADVGRAEAYQALLAANWLQYAGTVRNRFSRNILTTDILQFFLLGLLIGRLGWLQHAARHHRKLAWMAGAGLATAIAGNVVIYTINPSGAPWGNVAWTGANYGLTFFYIGIIGLAVTQWPRVRDALRVFAAPGRVGLTNYLMQSVVMTLLFARYGFNLDEPGTTLWVVVNLVFFFGVQVTLSRWWLQRFQFGPAEWAWRSMTYGALQPMRRQAAVRIPEGAVGVPLVGMPAREEAAGPAN